MKTILLSAIICILAQSVNCQESIPDSTTIKYYSLLLEVSSTYKNQQVGTVLFDNGKSIIVLTEKYAKKTPMYILNDVCKTENLKLLSTDIPTINGGIITYTLIKNPLP